MALITHKDRGRTRTGRTMRGAAMAEALVSMLVLIPFFVVIPLLGKQAHVQFKANETLRYTLWERTVWPGGGMTLNYTDNFKGDAQIRVEARDRILGHPGAGIRSLWDIVDNAATVDPLLTDLFGREMLARARNAPAPLQVGTSAGDAPIEVGHGSGPEVYRNRLTLENNQFLGADFAVTVVPAIEDWGSLTLGGRERGSNEGERHGRGDLRRHAKRGALLTDTWASPNESTYRERVARATWNGQVRSTADYPLERIRIISDIQQRTTPYASGNWAFGEARYGVGGQIVPDSGVILDDYIARE